MTVQTRAEAAGTTGWPALLSFALRRERLTLPWWLAGLGALLAFQSVSSQNFYDTPAKLAQLRATMSGNAAALAMGGPTRSLETIGGEILFEMFTYLAVVAGLMSMFLVGRHTRSDEETSRAELLRSTRIGRRAPVIAALALAFVANVAVAVVLFGAGVGTGLPVAGSALTGIAIGAVGMTFAAVTAVAAQIADAHRIVYGITTFVIAAAYVLRAIGDVGNGVASWFSPIGWGQRTYPFVVDRWWPLALFVAAIVVLVAWAFVLLDRRDFGAGLVRSGRGNPTAPRWLSSPLGLAWRLQRATLAAWCVGSFLLAAAYGSFAQSIEQFLEDNPVIADYLPGGVEDAVDSYLALTLGITALLAAAYGISSALRARAEETAGAAEPILAGPVSRTAWLGSHSIMALAGSAAVTAVGGLGEGLAHGVLTDDLTQPARLTAAALVYVPAVWIVVAVAVVGMGWVPRAAAVVAWAYFAYCVVTVLFAEAFDLPDWFDEAAPWTHTPLAPLESASPATAAVLLAIGAALAVFGLAGLRRRDIGY
ncbi:ABC transporter permease [Nocardia higoensis]|uniref:ABC transporter permease n=1 Tax=Nocardia higoensis TaxID=228599 RepID=A0ABS0DIX4_9NOCA|nr:ABC transporter permease [Nocardia higoensis]MBF6358416.1 ABC transporter permease [Nocardia higoensis]